MKILNRVILAIFLALPMLISCKQELTPFVANGEDGKIVIDMSVSIPGTAPITKAMGDLPEIRNIYVAVFGMNHYLNEFVQAIPLTSEGKVTSAYTPDGSGHYKVRVTLSRNATPRYVHVVANVNTPTPTFGYENDVMDTLESDAGDGYWQYIPFPSGITTTTISALNNIQLIRNFAWITVQLGSAVTSKWVFEAYEVYNTPSKGLFPVVTSEDDGEGNHVFATDYATKTFQEVLAGYKGRRSPDATLTTVPGAIDEAVGTSPRFVYENKVETPQETGATFIVLRLKNRSTSAIKYFRIDLENHENGYVPILRNFHYTVTVSGIGIEGYDTASEAATHPTRSDIFAGVDISQLTELSDGISNLRVSFAEIVFTQAHSGATFKYRFTPEFESNPTNHIKASLTDPSDDTVITGTSSDWNTGGAPVSSDPASPDYGWYQVSFNSAAPGTGIKSSTFEVTGENPTQGNTIVQTIKVITMPLQNFENVALSASGDTFTLSLDLPENLPRAMFPLTLVFEQPDAKIASNQIGVLTELEGTLKFMIKVSRESYESSRNVSFSFQSVKDIQAGDVIKVRDQRTDVSHDYFFNEENLPLDSYEFASNCSAATLELGNNKETVFTFDYLLGTLSPVTVTLVNLEPASSETQLSGSAGTYTFTPTAIGAQSLSLQSTSPFSEARISLSMAGKHAPHAVVPKRPNYFVISAGMLKVYKANSTNTPFSDNTELGYVLKSKSSSTSLSGAAGESAGGNAYFTFNSKSNVSEFYSTEAFTIRIPNFSGNLETAKVWFRLGSKSHYASVSLAELATNLEAELRFNE